MQLLCFRLILQLQQLQWNLLAGDLVDEREHQRIQIQHIQYHNAKIERRDGKYWVVFNSVLTNSLHV